MASHQARTPDYEACTTIELRRFTRDRGLSVKVDDSYSLRELQKWIERRAKSAGGHKNVARFSIKELEQSLKKYRIQNETSKEGQEYRATLISALREADLSLKFRFQDLPAELRTRVYECLLTLENNEKRCWPQILRTSKKIKSEASGVLYYTNTPRVLLEGNRISVLDSKYQRMYDNQMAMGVTDWPEFLLKLESLTLVLDKRWSYGIVLSLSCFLQTSSRLKEVIIECPSTLTVTNLDQFVSSHWPLGRLINRVDCQFKLFEKSPDAPVRLRALAAEHRTTFQSNTLMNIYIFEQTIRCFRRSPELLHFQGDQVEEADFVFWGADKSCKLNNATDEVRVQTLLLKANGIVDNIVWNWRVKFQGPVTGRIAKEMRIVVAQRQKFFADEDAAFLLEDMAALSLFDPSGFRVHLGKSVFVQQWRD